MPQKNAVRSSRAEPVAPRGEDPSQTARAFIGLRELLFRGEFARGDRISEIPLADRLGMSRTPIRLALERLAHLGLVDARSNGGFVVRAFTCAEVHDAIEFRGVLEGTAARLAAERFVDPGELDRLVEYRDAVLAAEISINSFADYMDRNEAFHAEIVRLAKSDMLRRLLDHVSSLPFASPSAMVFPTSVLAAAEETFVVAREHHRAIVDAIRNRQSTRAERIAQEHAQIAWTVFNLASADKDVLQRVPGMPLITMS
jgi:GntR family transcriptional regulator, vanillate catabolism transcriptional regulator